MADPEGRAQNIIEAVGRAGTKGPITYWAILALVVTTVVMGFLLYLNLDSTSTRYSATVEVLRNTIERQQVQNEAMMQVFMEDRPGKYAEKDRAVFLAEFAAMRADLELLQDTLGNNKKVADDLTKVLKAIAEEIKREKQPPRSRKKCLEGPCTRIITLGPGLVGDIRIG